jgi:hypothetical protein
MGKWSFQYKFTSKHIAIHEEVSLISGAFYLEQTHRGRPIFVAY